jgi:hypothetical protein
MPVHTQKKPHFSINPKHSSNLKTQFHIPCTHNTYTNQNKKWVAQDLNNQVQEFPIQILQPGKKKKKKPKKN